jgi:hypothetical protein
MFPLTGKYPRFNKYELLNGYLLPAPGATRTDYDLWASYATAEETGWSINVPYRAGLELARILRKDPPQWSAKGAELVVGPEDAVELLHFCSEFGLLGLLPAQASEVSVPSDSGKGARRFSKRVGHWFDDGVIPSAEYTGFDYLAWVEAYWMTATEMRPEWSTRRAAVTLKLFGTVKPSLASWLAVEDADVTKIGALFFGDIPPAKYPLPGSAPFWGLYREPVHIFIPMLWRFLAAAEALNSQPGENNADDQEIALSFLQELAREDDERTFLEGNAFYEFHRSLGLLPAFAVMFLRDWKAGRRVVSCHTCETIFVTADTRAKFCSERCRKTMLMRRYRAAKKQSIKE